MKSLFMLLAAVTVNAAQDCTEDDGSPEVQERIIGGMPAKVGEFPYIVFVRTVFGEGDYEYYRECGGSIIARDWVLTAASCLQVHGCPRCSYQRSLLRAGSRYQEKGGVVRSSHSPITLKNSIALLKVDEEWPLHGHCISLARLPRHGSLVPGGSVATIVGWGGIPLERAGRVDLLMQQVEVVGFKQCAAKYKQLDNTKMCTIFKEKGHMHITWESDAGCPVTVNGTVIGIIQGGYDGGSEAFPDVHIRVSAFTNWITTVTGAQKPSPLSL